MIKLDAGNVMLKPSHRKQLMAWLRRSLRLGKRLGDFVLTITLRRAGRSYEARAAFAPARRSAGCPSFEVRARQHEWLHAFRDLIRDLTHHLHARCLQRSPAF
jgi:hypothetical protein